MKTNPATEYAALFKDVACSLPGSNLEWLEQSRRQAVQDFTRIGFPELGEEEWKYTNVRPIARQIFTPSHRDANELSLHQIKAYLPPDLEANRLVFVDGYYSQHLSNLNAVEQDMEISTLASELTWNPNAIEPFLTDTPGPRNGFMALNNAFMADGVCIRIGAGVQVIHPLYLLFVTSAGETPVMSNLRNLILADDHSELTLIEHHVAIGAGRYLSNTVTDITMEPGANIQHYRIMQDGARGFHIDELYLHQAAHSQYSACSLALGGAMVRNETRIQQDAEDASTNMDGLYLLTGHQHLDNHIHIDHKQPHGSSNQCYKGVLMDSARAVFSSRVLVHPDAQKTDAHQSVSNLLLSDLAEADARPQLEIHADDVKCSHGATVGQPDRDAMFYLRSRGLDPDECRQILIKAFLDEVIQHIELEPVRTAVEEILGQRLDQHRGINR